jgi:hypothetical protein
MRRTLHPVLACALLQSAWPALAGGIQTFDDWSLACDNIRHCEAVSFGHGTGANGGEAVALALWIGLDAGPGAAVHMRLALQMPMSAPAPASLRLQAGTASVSVEPGTGTIAAPDAARLLPALIDADAAHAGGDRVDLSVSLRGLKDALSAIDQVQGRAGTVGAIVRKGGAPASAVPPAPKAAMVRLAALPAVRGSDAALFEQVLADLAVARPGGNDCWPAPVPGNAGPGAGASIGASVARLSDQALLVLRRSPATGYDARWCAWIVHDHAPWLARTLPFAGNPGEPDARLEGNVGFEARQTGAGRVGLLTAGTRLRAIGDCGTRYTWGWTGRAFLLTGFDEDQQCGGIEGGVPLRRWIVDTVPPT